jgi:hypothetical protein
MTQIKKIITFFLMQIVLMNINMIIAKGQTSYFNTKYPLVGARAASLADALVAESYDANSMYSNPAALAYINKSAIVISHNSEKYFSAMADHIGFPVRTGSSETMAFGISVNHIGYLSKTSLTNIRPYQIGYDFAYAREIMPTFSVGGRIGARYGKAGDKSLMGVGTSIGICYSPSPEITYGAAFNGIGTGINYIISGGTTAIRSMNLQRSLQAGVAMRYPAVPNRNIVSVAISNEKVFGKTGIHYSGGIEIYPIQFFAIRGGYIVESQIRSARYGFGLRSVYGNLDLSVSPSRSTDQSIFITGSFILWKNEPRY